MKDDLNFAARAAAAPMALLPFSATRVRRRRQGGGGGGGGEIARANDQESPANPNQLRHSCVVFSFFSFFFHEKKSFFTNY